MLLLAAVSQRLTVVAQIQSRTNARRCSAKLVVLVEAKIFFRNK